ncbi:MAG: DUF1989 domain-containing protein [Candidatus Rokuibacteriota bacterium]
MASGGRIHIPAGEGRATRIPAGGRFRITDLQGTQCCDLFVFNANDVSEFASAEHTRVYNGNLFPRVAQPFVTQLRRPILWFEEDRTPGKHDMLVAACNPSRYALLGVQGWHASCEENLLTALRAMGYEARVPQPINLFTNIPLGPGGELRWLPALTAPGDYVVFRAEMEVIVCASSCPQDVVPINDRNVTDLELAILR